MEQGVDKRIEREDANVTDFGAHLEPALRVGQGETFVVETQDNFFGEIKTEEDQLIPEQVPFLRAQFWTVNPAGRANTRRGLQGQ